MVFKRQGVGKEKKKSLTVKVTRSSCGLYEWLKNRKWRLGMNAQFSQWREVRGVGVPQGPVQLVHKSFGLSNEMAKSID